MRPHAISALMLGALLFPVSYAAAQPAAAPDISGDWSGTFGDTRFTVSDRRDAQGRVIAKDVRGAYKGEDGKVVGELRGPVLSGVWVEPHSSVQCKSVREGSRYWGRIELTFNPSADAFNGKWGYCEEAPARGWSGQRAGPAPMAAASAPGAPAGPAPAPRRAGGGWRSGLGAALAGVAAGAVGGRVGGYTGAVIANEAANAMTAPPPSAAAPGAGGCTGGGQPNAAGRVAGAVGGALLDRQLSRMRVYNYGVRSTVHSALMDTIACILSPRERQQAAAATEQVVQRGVGATSRWESQDRPGVTGSSTVASEQKLAGGGVCRVVNDVVIVEGEETTVQKRMCRAPGATGFTLQT